MIRLLFALLYLTRVVQGTDTTSPTCQEVPEGSYRSVWSILGSCALTLIICLWHTLHIDVPEPGKDGGWFSILHVLTVIGGFFAPELVIGYAAEQWIGARKSVIHFHEKGYAWSMTHSYFADNGGFVYRDRGGNVEVIKTKKFLELCEAGKIVNPLVTEDEIKDRSKSDAVSKAIFAIQLLWFVLQVGVRHSIGLQVTLVELDTLCMAVLAVFYLLLWWSKPLSVRRPHIFYESTELYVYPREKLSEAWRRQPGFLRKLWYARVIEEKSSGDTTEGCYIMRKIKAALNEAIDNMSLEDVESYSIKVASCVLGALHLLAWNYEFPTEKEKLIWRCASLVLTGGALVSIIAELWVDNLEYFPAWYNGYNNALIFPAVVCRVMLAILMLRSLRALPCSAHQIVSWVQYIPHL